MNDSDIEFVSYFNNFPEDSILYCIGAVREGTHLKELENGFYFVFCSKKEITKTSYYKLYIFTGLFSPYNKLVEKKIQSSCLYKKNYLRLFTNIGIFLLGPKRVEYNNVPCKVEKNSLQFEEIFKKKSNVELDKKIF